MSKISKQKALESYPIDIIPDDDTLGFTSSDRNEVIRLGYIKGYDQAMQDFLEKAEEYLRKEFVDMWLRYFRGHSMDDEIKMFKNYMQDDNNKENLI